MLLSLSSLSQANDSAQLELLKKEIHKLQQWLVNAQQESDQLNRDLRQSDIDLGKLNQQVDHIKQQLDAERERLKKLRLEQGQLQLHQNKQRLLLSTELRAAQRLGQDGPIKLLLHQDDPQQAQRMMRYFYYFNQARIERIHQILAELHKLENIVEAIADSEKNLRLQQQQLLVKQQALAQQKNHQQKLLEKLNASMASEQQNLAAKEANRQRLEKLLADVQTLLDRSPRQKDARPIRQLKGQLPLPVKGRILQAYDRQQRGWLIAAESGQDVKAIHHGRVVFADWLRGYGLVIILDHGQGYLSLYAHNQTLLRDIGSWVNHGDLIATAGSSGGQERPALYFEIRYRGQPLDPAAWLAR